MGRNIKKWECTAEVNMDASRYETVVVEANTERKARKLAEAKLKQNGAFFVTNMSVKQTSV